MTFWRFSIKIWISQNIYKNPLILLTFNLYIIFINYINGVVQLHIINTNLQNSVLNLGNMWYISINQKPRNDK